MLKLLGRFILWIAGWKTEGKYPDIDKSLMVIAPHTSMWDFVMGRVAFWALGINGKFMIKEEMFKFPLSIIIKAFGGIAVDRSTGNRSILSVGNIISKSRRIILVITPEGTRKRVPDWKKGFYLIARHAKVPIVMGCLDYKTKTAIIGPTIHPSDDYEEVKGIMNEFYRGHHGKHPEWFHLYEEGGA